MSLAAHAARHSRVIVLAVILLTAAGVYSIGRLPSNIYPEVEFPRIVMVAASGTLSPRLMMIAVTRPLEEAARTVIGVRRVRSKTIRGETEISVLFNPGTDMRYALQLMQAQTEQVKASLPEGTSLVVERMTPSVFPIFSLNVTGDLPAVDLRDIALYQLRPLVSRIAGVGRVEVLASDEREISVIVDPERLGAAHLTIDQVADALRATNDITSVGRLAKDYKQFLILSTAEIKTLDDIRHAVVAFRGQTPVYVGDLAEVREGVVDKTTLVTGNGEPAAIVTVARQIGGNILDITDGVLTALRAYRPSLPPTLRVTVVYDLAAFVREAVGNVRDAILIGGFLAVLVLIGFLRNWRATAIAATTLPLTLIGTFFVLHLAGGTINLMSLGGLAIAIGLVIDDAIVVVENIHRHHALGEPQAVAVEKGTNELVAAVVGSTLTTVVVFVPLGLLQGVVGQFFTALSLTLAAAVLLSLAYALLFIPVVAQWMGSGPVTGPAHGPGFLARRYEGLLRVALRHPWVVVAATLVAAGAGGFFYTRLETGFLPEMDEGGFVVDYITPAGTSLDETDRMVRRIEAVIKDTPEVASFSRRTGTEMGLFATEQNEGDILVKLKPRSQRSRSADDVIADDRERLAEVAPGMTIEFVQLLQDMLGDLEGAPQPVEVKLYGDDLNQLATLADQVGARLAKIPGIVDVVIPQRSNPELEVRVDPTRAAKAGFTVDQVTSQLGTGLLGQVATELRLTDRLVDIRVRYPDRDRYDLNWVRAFPLAGPEGATVPLAAVAAVVPVEGENRLYREDLKEMVPVTARLENRDLGSAVAEVRRMMGSIALPIGYSYEIGGQYESQQESFRSMLLVLSLAVLLVFGVLVAQFRRFTPALVILSAAPLSLVGAFGLMVLTGTPLNVSSFMGLILLAGLIVKNGIILIDYVDQFAREGPNFTEVLVRAGSVRLRPILMTTLCTLFGLLPLALGLGSGAELQKPLAIAVIGGLSVSTVITLVFVPVVMKLVGGDARG